MCLLHADRQWDSMDESSYEGKRISLKAGEKREMIQRQVYEVVKQMQFQADLGSSKWTAAIFVKPVVQAN